MAGNKGGVMKKIMIVFLMGASCLVTTIQACRSRHSEPLTGPLILSSEAKEGEVLYNMHCQKCHPLGEAGLGPAINSNPAPGFVKRFQVRHGLGVMPSFKKDEISAKQLTTIVKYMKARKKN
jgi:mono/diheme cytochrome c family protein